MTARQVVAAGRRPPAHSAAPLEGTLSYLRLLWDLGRGLQAASKRMARDLGLTGPQRLVVRALGSSPGLTSRELAGDLSLDPASVAGLVRRLVRDGFVRSERDPLDRRRTLLSLTARGALLASGSGGTVEEVIEAALVQLTPEDPAAAHRVLVVLVAALGEAPLAAVRTVPPPSTGQPAPARRGGRSP